MDADSHTVCRCNLNSIYVFRSISTRRYQQSGAEVHAAPSSGLYFPVQGTSSLGSSVSSLWKGKQSRATCFLGQCWSSPSELSPAPDASPKCRAASQRHSSFLPLRGINAPALHPWQIRIQAQALQRRLDPHIHTLLSQQPWPPGSKTPPKQVPSSETHRAPQLGAQH